MFVVDGVEVPVGQDAREVRKLEAQGAVVDDQLARSLQETVGIGNMCKHIVADKQFRPAVTLGDFPRSLHVEEGG